MTLNAAIVLGTLLATTLAATRAANATNDRIVFVSPASAQLFQPGNSIPVEVRVDPAIKPTSVWVETTALPGVEFSTAPYKAELPIPKSMTGEIEISVIVITSNGPIEGPTVRVLVRPGSSPTAITVPERMSLTFPDPSPLGSRVVAVQGVFSDGSQAWVDASMGTIFVSSDAEVFTVNQEGELTARGLGVAYLTVANGGATAMSQVTVTSCPSCPGPTIEQTAKLKIQRGAFRREPNSAFVLQDITVTNIGPLPVPGNCSLVLTGLESSVSVQNEAGRTRYIQPLNSPFVRIKALHKPTLSPGESASATLRFRNPEDGKIEYSLRIFSGIKL